MLPFIFKDKLHFTMQTELLTLSIVGRILALAGQIPVERGRGRIALEHAIRKIREGYSVVVFPEGILTGTHELKRIGTGVARLAAKTGAPCIPVGFHIPSKFIRVIHKWAYGRDTVGGWQFGGRCFVTIGEPMRVTVDKGAEIKVPFYREFTTNLMECVYALADHSRARSGEPAVLQYHPPTLTEVN